MEKQNNNKTNASSPELYIPKLDEVSKILHLSKKDEDVISFLNKSPYKKNKIFSFKKEYKSYVDLWKEFNGDNKIEITLPENIEEYPVKKGWYRDYLLSDKYLELQSKPIPIEELLCNQDAPVEVFSTSNWSKPVEKIPEGVYKDNSFDLLLFFAALSFPANQREIMLGDLCERFETDRNMFGKRKAKILLIKDISWSLYPLIKSVTHNGVTSLLKTIGLYKIFRYFYS